MTNPSASGSASVETESPFQAILVEDSDTDCYLIQEAARLMHLNADFKRFPTVPSAIEGLTSESVTIPHCVFLDLNLPGGDGLDVLKVIRESPRIKEVPVVVLTSSISPRDMERAKGMGVHAFLEKPSHFREFVAVVQKVLSELRPH